MSRAERQQLFSMAGQSILSGCSARQIESILSAGHAGMTLRQMMNDTIHETECTLLMMLANAPDTEESALVADVLKRHGARLDQPDSTRRRSNPLYVAADFGKYHLVKWLVANGAAIEYHPPSTPTLAVYLTCQNNQPQCTGILVKAALDQQKVAATLDKKSKSGMTPAYVSMERGHAKCMGALAMGGADLRQGFATYWTAPGCASTDHEAPHVDPDPDIQPQASLMQALLSFTTLQCAHCHRFGGKVFKHCSRCRMAQYCSRKCQEQDWKFHKKCCKQLRQGQDFVATEGALPDPPNEVFGFTLPFAGDDFTTDDDDDEDSTALWEYNAGSRGSPDWRRYPIRIEQSLESMLEMGSPRYMYRPGNAEAEGQYEAQKSVTPPSYVATNYVYFCDMLEREFYTGAIRAVRRNGSRKRPKMRSSFGF